MNDYWKKRAILIENDNFKNTQYHLEKLQEQYEIAKTNIQKEINDFYTSFAINNQMSLAEAKRILDNKELKEFKTTLKQYKKLVENSNNIDEELLKKINNISIMQRITRKQSLEAKISIIIEQLQNSIVDEINDNFFKTLNTTYYKNLYSIESQYGYHTDFSLLNNKIIDNILTYNWSGVTYSERIWRNKNKLKEALTDTLNKNFIQGNSIQELSAEMAKSMDTSYKNCVRLVRTEVNHLNNRAAIQAYKEKDIKQYQFVAVLDLRTSEMCADMDGKIIDIEELVAGVNCPPLHPNCRSTVMPYVKGLKRNRIAKNRETGENEELGDITYKEWYEKYVTNNNKDDIMSIPNILTETAQKHNQSISKQVEEFIDKNIRDNDIIEDLSSRVPFAYDKKRDKIIINKNHNDLQFYQIDEAISHEIVHMKDIKNNITKNNFDLLYDKMNKARLYIQNNYSYFYDYIDKNSSDMSTCDILSALSRGKLSGDFGHTKEYWKNDTIVINELAADLISSRLTDNKVVEDLLKEIPPLKEFRKECMKLWEFGD